MHWRSPLLNLSDLHFNSSWTSLFWPPLQLNWTPFTSFSPKKVWIHQSQTVGGSSKSILSFSWADSLAPFPVFPRVGGGQMISANQWDMNTSDTSGHSLKASWFIVHDHFALWLASMEIPCWGTRGAMC